MSNCIFCRIAAGEIPSDKVYEDDLIVAFMDINPVAPGHVLVVPKRHSTEIMGMTDEEMSAAALAVKRIAAAAVAATGAEGFNVLNNCGRAAGQAVDHVHFHVIPRSSGDGRGYRWVTLKYAEGQGAELARSIANRLK